MSSNLKFQISNYVLLIIFSLFSSSVVFASTTNGTASGYAWSDKIGWINFGVDTGNIHITDNNLTGYAWSSNYGWINLNPSTSGVINDAEGNLSGYAWAENLGWINFSGVTINSSGQFSGTAIGDNAGTINFSCASCNIITDWRPASSRIIAPVPSGGGGGGSILPPSLSLSITINNGDLYTNKKLVEIYLQAKDDSKEILISNYSDFRDAKKERFVNKKTWQLQEGDGEKFVYIKFFTDQNSSSDVFKDSIILDTKNPEINISGLNKNYNTSDEVTLHGTSEVFAILDIYLDDYYGNLQVDETGSFFITLGSFLQGQHKLQLIAKDLANNKSLTYNFEFFVLPKEGENVIIKRPSFLSPITEKIKNGLQLLIPNLIQKQQKPVAQMPILDKIGQGLQSLLPFLPQKTNKIVEKKPKPIVMVPQTPPDVFSGKWSIFPKEPIKKFVLSPLPKDIAMLEQKFPQLAKTFNEVGVGKITDLQKIKNADLNLPGLTEVLGLSEIEISPGKFIPAKGIPVAKLTSQAKDKMPSEIVFAKTAGGLVDYNIALSLNEKGNTQQTIQTITGSDLQLVFKADGNVKRVIGYIVFKSKKQSPVSVVQLESLALSPIFSGPSLVASLTPSKKIPIEGAKVKETVKETDTKEKPTEIEKRLIIAEFEYYNTGNGVYTANIQAPVVDGEYEIITVVDYQEDGLLKPVSKEVKLVTVVDPEGYIYEKDGQKETRIVGAVVSLYWQNPQTMQYELWPAGDYQQENPQVTNVSGTYSFLVPEGYYYLKVVAPGYLTYDGKPFQVKEGSGVHINVELKTKYWWLNVVDWKTALLVIVIMMLAYNFYRDKMRDKMALKQQ